MKFAGIEIFSPFAARFVFQWSETFKGVQAQQASTTLADFR